MENSLIQRYKSICIAMCELISNCVSIVLHSIVSSSWSCLIILLNNNQLPLYRPFSMIWSKCLKVKIYLVLGSGFGSVGRAIASNSKGPRFESSHQQKFILNIFCQLYWKDENKEKEAGNGPFLKNNYFSIPVIQAS